MCGIYGVYGERNDLLAKTLQGELINRGPDCQGIYSDDYISIGMNRLHLRGDEKSQLPFRLEKSVVSYNGEIYGRYEDNTYRVNEGGGIGEIDFFHESNSDKGVDGMYAIAEYNRLSHSLKLNRDKIGIKPLFYTQSGGKTVFGSCFRSLLGKNIISQSSVNFDALFDVFTYGYSLTEDTVINEIKELLPGSELSLSKEGVSMSKYSMDESEIGVERKLSTSFHDSILACIQGGYKIGLAVSGGVDSTIIAHKLNDLGLTGVETFSVFLKEADDGVKDLSELGLKKGGAWETWKHSYVKIEEENFKEYMLESIDQFSYPTDMHSLPLYTALAKLVQKNNIRVLLTGEGADELFMGYSKYLTYKGDQLPSAYYLNGKKGEFIQKIFNSETFKEGVARGDSYSQGEFWSQIRSIELKCRLQKLLLRTDVILMEHCIEGRTPFLHAGIPEIALSSSIDGVRGKQGKQMLRDEFDSESIGLKRKEKKRFKASEQLFINVFSDPEIRELVYEETPLEGINLGKEIIDEIYEAYSKGDQSDLSELLFLVLTTKQLLKRK